MVAWRCGSCTCHLPKSRKASVGDSVYCSMHSGEKFLLDYMLDCVEVLLV
jgi:hypothetical protein